MLFLFYPLNPYGGNKGILLLLKTAVLLFFLQPVLLLHLLGGYTSAKLHRKLRGLIQHVIQHVLILIQFFAGIRKKLNEFREWAQQVMHELDESKQKLNEKLERIQNIDQDRHKSATEAR